MKNDYEVRGDITAIFIKSKKYGNSEVLISTSKLEIVTSFPGSWYLNRFERSIYCYGSYIDSDKKQRKVILHRLITNTPECMVVDHINHDTLNNTDENLRVCTVSENQQNRIRAQKNNKTSGIRGVYLSNGKWRAAIRCNGKHIHLGYFADLREAEKAVIEARSKYMPYSLEAFDAS